MQRSIHFCKIRRLFFLHIDHFLNKSLYVKQKVVSSLLRQCHECPLDVSATLKTLYNALHIFTGVQILVKKQDF